MTRLAVTLALVCALSVASPVHADVERGDRGPDVTTVQQQLADMGYTVAVDSVFGRQTEKAVRHFQRSSGLTPDGVVGPITSAALRGTQIALTEPPAPPTTQPQTVEEIIRAAWPDNLEDKAVAIAWRESRHQPDAHNFCCHGLFQVYWSIHKPWLATVGVTTVDQLYDAATNARIAYLIYQRAGGWGPWAL